VARIGVIVPFDFALDREYWQWAPEDVSLHITRTPPHFGPVGVELARAVSETGEAADATRTLVEIAPDSIAYACTSGSFVDGLDHERALRDAIEGASPGSRAITTSGALLDALRALGVRRVGLGTPYVSELGRLLADFVRAAGFEPVSLANLELESGIADVAEDEVRHLAAAAHVPAAEALFLSCTNLRTFEALPALEAQYGIPVLSANQVTMWSALRAAGATLPDIPQRLFRATAPAPA
jgi:maleate isomerase